MKALVALVLATGVASAAPITPPPGWTVDPSLAPPPAATRFGGAVTKVTVYAYRAPSPGAVLYVNRAEAEVPAADRDRLATIELEEPRAALRRQGANAKAEQDAQRFDAAAKQLEANVSWRDATAGVRDTSRVVVAGDDKKLVAVTAQCVLAADAAADVVKACEAALATIDAEVPAASRVPLAIQQTVVEPPPKPEAAVLGEGGGAPIMRVDQPASEPDRRPVYMGLGLIVLAAVFWWNKQRREKFERENPQEVPDRVPRATAKKARSGAGDDDADDLHAAAEDNGEKK